MARLYRIIGKYKPKNGGYEKLDEALTLKDAKNLTEEYKKSHGKDWDIVFYRVH